MASFGDGFPRGIAEVYYLSRRFSNKPLVPSPRASSRQSVAHSPRSPRGRSGTGRVLFPTTTMFSVAVVGFGITTDRPWRSAEARAGPVLRIGRARLPMDD